MVRQVLRDDADADGRDEMRAEIMFHGTNEILRIATETTREGKSTTVTTKGGRYVVSECDGDGDGIFESITISIIDGDILEILGRDRHGNYKPTPQSDLDEMNRITRKIDSLLREESPKSTQ